MVAAPQIAESAWPYRGTGPATAALHPGAVIPSFDNRFRPGNFRPRDTSAGNSHIELGEQPFDFSTTGPVVVCCCFSLHRIRRINIQSKTVGGSKTHGLSGVDPFQQRYLGWHGWQQFRIRNTRTNNPG